MTQRQSQIRPTRASGGKWSDPHAGYRGGGELVTKSLTGWTGQPSGLVSVMLRLTETERLVRPFAQSGLVYSCVQVRAKLLSQARAVLWESEDEDAEEVAATDPLARVLRRPNPIMGRVKFWRTISQHFDLAGGTFLFLTSGKTDEPISPGEVPGAIWPVREDHVTVNLGEGNRPESYEFSVGDKQVRFPAHAVAHLYDSDPDNPLRGIGPLQAAFRTVNNLYKAEAFDDALTENGGQIGGILSPKGDENFTTEQLKPLQDSLQQNHLDPRKSGRVAVVPAGVDFTAASFSPRDMQAKDLRILGRNHVMMIFGVTPPLLGIVEDVNRANGREARRVFYESSGVPFLEFLADEISAQLLPKIGYEDRAFGFDWRSLPAMREDADSVQKRVRGWMEVGRSFREAAEIEQLDIDLEEMDGVDERFRVSTLVPADEPAPGAEEVEEDPPRQLARTASARARRVEALEAIERRLAPHDQRLTRAVARVFRAFVQAQRDRLTKVAAEAGELSAVHPWRWFPTPSAHAREWGDALDLAVSREWREVRGISADELELLLVHVDEKWRAQLWDAARKPLTFALDDAARAAASEIEALVQIDATAPALVRFLAQEELILKEGPLSAVAEQVKRALVEGMADAPNVGTLADRVRVVLEEMQEDLAALQDRLGTRAAMIARTESSAASSAARAEQFRAAGVVQHEWASAGDEVVREEHQIDGEITVVGEPFSNGMRWPADVNAPPGMRINDRCAVLPVLPELAIQSQHA